MFAGGRGLKIKGGWRKLLIFYNKLHPPVFFWKKLGFGSLVGFVFREKFRDATN